MRGFTVLHHYKKDPSLLFAFCACLALGGVLDLNLYGDMPTKIFSLPSSRILPSKDTQCYKKLMKSILHDTKTGTK